MSDELSDFFAGVRDDLDGEIARERRVVTPDFAAVVEAARERNPDVVSEAAVREVGEFAPIVELGAERRIAMTSSDEAADLLLNAWIDDARMVAEADVAARRLAGVPPLREVARAEPPRRWWPYALAVAAVVVGAAVSIPRLLDAFVDGNYREAESTSNQAEYVGPDRPVSDGLRLRPQPEPLEPISQRAIQRSTPPPQSEEPKQVEPRVRPRTRQRDRIAQLDAEAQARWAKGDLAGAEQRFREIITLADEAHRRYADLAYGDLFTLARQRRDRAAEHGLWKEYLERFPGGRFADDARAGLCRRAAPSEHGRCWAAYLDDFPQGVHTRAAERALGREPVAESP